MRAMVSGWRKRRGSSSFAANGVSFCNDSKLLLVRSVFEADRPLRAVSALLSRHDCDRTIGDGMLGLYMLTGHGDFGGALAHHPDRPLAAVNGNVLVAALVAAHGQVRA